MRFAPEYVACVLNENFEDAKALFLEPMMAMHYAHLVMLADCGIVSREDAHTIREALDAVPIAEIRKVCYDGTYEDLFYYIERLVATACDEKVAGRLHTARSRNDIDMTLYRMRQRQYVLSALQASLRLREALLDVASRHRETILALHTHTQPAQPSTVAHYLLAMIEQLERDATRLKAAYETTNRNPLGACAITGTGFPIDRDLTSRLLGFSGPTGNTYGSIATTDYLLENVTATAVLLAGLGRFVQDMLLWSTAEFAYLRIGDGFVQGSSIMPQKRNPVALEHARAIGSKALGEATGILMCIHNTPFGDIVDTEDDLQPLVDRMFHDAARALTLVAAAMASAEFDTARLERRAGEGWITITELSDTLVREHGLAFDTAHAIARRIVQAKSDRPDARISDVLADASAELLGAPIRYSEERVTAILSPRHFVAIRTTHGGPAPDETARAVAASRAALESDGKWLDRTRASLAAAAELLKERSAGL
ncbi:MAG: argininosuccinate lyase [Acidobacteria bacterium]|nr:argininosuccinate lyase [Acidobacteriota bacterium]